MKVLVVKSQKMTIQVGTNDNEVIEFNLDKIDNDTLGVASDNLFDAKTGRKKELKATGDAIDANALGISGGTKYATNCFSKSIK